MNKFLVKSYEQDMDYFASEVGLKDFDLSQHNEETLAQMVEDYYNAMDIADPKSSSIYQWQMAAGLLDRYLSFHYCTFKESDLVYRWAKDKCKERNRELIKYRAYGYWCGTFCEYIKKVRGR